MNPGGRHRRTSSWWSLTDVSRGNQKRVAATRHGVQAAADTHSADVAEVAVAVDLAAPGAVRDAGRRRSHHVTIPFPPDCGINVCWLAADALVQKKTVRMKHGSLQKK